MNKERYNQIIDEAYNNYVKTSKPTLDGKYISQPEFIFWVKTNDNFSKKCGLKIEERELTYDEKVHEARRRFGFELEDGSFIDITVSKETKTYYDYEIEENEKKRVIKILKPEFVPTVDQEFRRVIVNGE